MINIINKVDCVGCNACTQRCPKQCISMHEDEQGFLYPEVDLNHCIGCNLCEKVCPVLNQFEPRNSPDVYAARNLDADVLFKSSSGGVFSSFASLIIDEGGVVFGAKFNDTWDVVHDYTESADGLSKFRGSKYVQSSIGRVFQQTEAFLKEGRKVLFTGTPCQIAGLKHYLGKEYDNLISVDLICHGVPSPLVWREYLKYITARPTGAQAGKNTGFLSMLSDKKPVITGINFRDKRLGWEKYGFSVHVFACQGEKNRIFCPL